ncbi:MAG: acetate--CoA ligase family protein [Thermodesulfovibrionales bacterium]|nr:acetate--CoA ligase family protein [Thermodesulfovibrionales bacterium]
MLNSLFNPDSIAVIGASRDPKKVGYAVLNNLIRFGYKGQIYPVNPSGEEILGLKSFSNLSDIGGKIALAVIAVPAKFVPETIIKSADAGAGAVVILSAGFKEAGPEGVRLEQELGKISRERNIRILGPNCLGIINTSNNMNATFAAGMLPKGKLAFFSQSGALGIAILDWAIGNKIGFSKFISLGNKTDLNEIDFIEYFINDPETDIILGYIEDVVDGRRFLDIAKKATKTKPVILLKSGGTEAGARAASSHTGALAGSENAFNAAFKQTGVIRAQGIQDLFDTALAFSGQKLPQGDRLLIITNAGGPGIIAADTAEKLGLKLPQMTKNTIESIIKLLPPNASLYNPVDIIGDATSERYAVVLDKAIHDPNVDGIIVILTPQAMVDVENTAEIVINTSKKTDRPIITSFMGEMRVRGSVEKLKANFIPNFSYPETAVNAFKKLSDYNSWRNLEEEKTQAYPSNRDIIKTRINDLLQAGRFQAGEDDAMALLSEYGFIFPQRALAKTSKESSDMALRIGFPVVMKISSPDILHKTDVGGVKLKINSKKEAEDAFIEITSNAKRLMPDAFINGVMIYEMIKSGKEVILGVTFDRTFGHMIMFGLGGIYVEVLKDVSFRIAPVSRREASTMVSEIKTNALLKGARGEKPVDIDSIIDGISRLSGFVTDFPIVRELDINPLVVMEKGAVALDARIIFERKENN